MDFQLTDCTIEPAVLLAKLGDVSAGACVTFEGRVRNHNDGRKVVALDYEAYIPLAEKEGIRIVGEARAKFPILEATCMHRTGSLALGDVAVWVAVTGAHRAAAFEACRYIIDEVKARLPIWKREHYVGGTTEWINCASRVPESVETPNFQNLK
jgi:molybdopterin synthase catalytic subunit